MDMNLEKSQEPVAIPSAPRPTSRRYFLKGTSLALPAVITLHSGTALANAVARQSLACGGQGNLSQNTPVLCAKGDTAGELYMRQEVTLYKKLTFGTESVKTTTGTGKNSVTTTVVIKTITIGDTKGAGERYYFEGKGVWRYCGLVDNPPGTEVKQLEKAALAQLKIATFTGGKNDSITITGVRYKVINGDKLQATPATMLAIINLDNKGQAVAVGAPPGSTIGGSQPTYVTSVYGACLQSLIGRNQLG